MDRLHHIRETLPANIRANRRFKRAEFVILDYSSRDGLEDWIRSEMSDHIQSGLVLYAQMPGQTRFHMAHAKNVAHRLARGEILCNLDADNFTGYGFAAFLNRILRPDRLAIVKGNKKGVYGRIALRREHFFKLGGYCEEMRYGWGHEDADFAARASRMGMKSIYFRPGGSAIQHDDRERALNQDIKEVRNSSRRHRIIGQRNLRAGQLVANCNVPWGAGTVLINFQSFLTL